MRPLSRDEIRGIDRAAIELGVPGVVLMENAGRNAADEIEAVLDKKPASVAIVAGAGNNGGDGFVIARHLAIRGHRVAVFLCAPQEKVRGDANTNLQILIALSFDIRQGTDALAQLVEYDIVVDAIGGTGVTGELRGWMLEAVEAVNSARRPVVAIDIPTGLDCDTGIPGTPTVKAQLTVTMLASKKGFENPASQPFTGKVKVVDIGIPAQQVASLAAGEE